MPVDQSSPFLGVIALALPEHLDESLDAARVLDDFLDGLSALDDTLLTQDKAAVLNPRPKIFETASVHAEVRQHHRKLFGIRKRRFPKHDVQAMRVATEKKIYHSPDILRLQREKLALARPPFPSCHQCPPLPACFILDALSRTSFFFAIFACA
jgi:hypothetical protein